MGFPSAYITHNATKKQSDITRVKSSEKAAASSGDTEYFLMTRIK